MRVHSRRVVTTAVLLVALGLGAASVSPAYAQEKSRLDPETIAILGEPDPPEDALDADVIAVLGQPEGTVPANEADVNQRAHAIGAKLRCPVCQGVAISDSPAGMAVKMRGQVRKLVAQGYSEEQVLLYFERSYGEFVRLEPPMQGLNVMLWLLPLVFLMGGGAFVAWKAKKPTPAPSLATEPSTSAESEKVSEKPAVDPALARYLERVRRDSGSSS
jgi:cytochrome c-type biogenesis protein CcmH